MTAYHLKCDLAHTLCQAYFDKKKLDKQTIIRH